MLADGGLVAASDRPAADDLLQRLHTAPGIISAKMTERTGRAR